MQVAVLGPVVARRDDVVIDLGAPKQRALLTALALDAGRPVPPDRLIELLWADDPPSAVAASLQTYVAGLRRALEPGRVARAPATIVVTSTLGYSLQLAADALDVGEFAATIDAVHRRLSRTGAGVPRLPDDVDISTIRRLRAALQRALGSWRGEPFAELGDHHAVQAERSRLTGLRLVAVEDLALLGIALGEESAVAGELSRWVRSNPLRESMWALLALALVRSGRQGEALDTVRRIRSVLAEELGVDPGPAMQALETAMLRQSDVLWWQPADPGGPVRIDRPPAALADDTGGAVSTGQGDRPGDRSSDRPGDSPGGQPGPGERSRAGGVPVRGDQRWPMVGRTREMAELRGTLDAAGAGTAAIAVLIGEPGVGKSRLLQEIAVDAEQRGFVVVKGACSQDEGAPPLWPWSKVLRALELAHPVEPARWVGETAATSSASERTGGSGPTLHGSGMLDLAGATDADVGQFGLWEAVAARLLAAAATRPLLVQIEDLHWADPSTVKLLRHLVETVTEGRLAVMASRRALPEPTGPLAALGESLARRPATRLALDGLAPQDVQQLITVGTGRPATLEAARDLRDRTAGNAFFLTELIRSDLSGQEIPSVVADVVLGRLSGLPEATRRAMRSAAVIGRDFGPVLLSGVVERSVDDTLDALEPARAVGLIVEDDAERFRFSHALVRDAIYDAIPASARARRHAAVAAAIEQGPGIEPDRARSEAARHWLSAGPSRADRAWRAAAAAAQEASSLHAWDEAGELLAAAVTAQRSDHAATDRERYDLAIAQADVCRWSGDRTGLDEALMAAIGHAERLGDVELVAAAAIGTVDGSVWPPRSQGQTYPPLIAALRDVLRRLPAADSELRCRVMLALAVELYFADAPRERDALVEQGLAVARRLADPTLTVWANAAAHLASWRADTAEKRYLLAVESVDAAGQIGDPRKECVARTILAGIAQETGRVERMWTEIRLARALAGTTGLVSPLVALGWLEIPWLAMQGKFEQAQQLFGQTLALMQRTTMAQQTESPAGAALALRMAMAPVDDSVVAGFTPVVASSPLPMRAHLLMLMLRAGQRDQAIARFAEFGVELDHDDWFSLQQQCQAAEASLGLGAADLGATVYRWLAPYAGRVCCAGAAVALGPVDGYLAMAAAAAGETAVATRHADDALELCRRWEIPLVATWLEAQRRTYRF